MTIEPKKPASDNSAAPLSPYRALFAIVPLVVIVIVGTALLINATNIEREQAIQEENRNSHTPFDFDFDRLAPSPEGPSDPDAAALPQAPLAGEFDAAAVVALLPTASAQSGENNFRMCAPCHSAEKGAAHRVGPTLWGIVGRQKASDPAFAYSAALKAKGGSWTNEELAAFLHKPRVFAPGTSMAFFGITSTKRMAELLAYLATLTDEPGPKPDHATQR